MRGLHAETAQLALTVILKLVVGGLTSIILFVLSTVNPQFRFVPISLRSLLRHLSWLRIHLQCRRPWFDSWVGKICWRSLWLPTPVFLGFPGGSAGKESTCNVGALGSIPGLGRSPEEGEGYPPQYSGLENSADCIVHGVAKSWTRLSDFHFHFPWGRVLKLWQLMSWLVWSSCSWLLPHVGCFSV